MKISKAGTIWILLLMVQISFSIPDGIDDYYYYDEYVDLTNKTEVDTYSKIFFKPELGINPEEDTSSEEDSKEDSHSEGIIITIVPSCSRGNFDLH